MREPPAPGGELLAFKGHLHSVRCVAFSSATKLGSRRTRTVDVLVWDADTGQELHPRGGTPGRHERGVQPRWPASGPRQRRQDGGA